MTTRDDRAVDVCGVVGSEVGVNVVVADMNWRDSSDSRNITGSWLDDGKV
jgi:hypothetical protein